MKICFAHQSLDQIAVTNRTQSLQHTCPRNQSPRPQIKYIYLSEIFSKKVTGTKVKTLLGKSISFNQKDRLLLTNHRVARLNHLSPALDVRHSSCPSRILSHNDPGDRRQVQPIWVNKGTKERKTLVSAWQVNPSSSA